MNEMKIHRLVADLADRIRDLPRSDVSEDVRQRCMELIRQLNAHGLVGDGHWNLTPR
jgi:hypothetical protein